MTHLWVRLAGITAVIVSLGLIMPSGTTISARTPGPHAANCANTSVGFTPLIDLGTGTYKGYKGGLYGSDKNAPPAAYLKYGLARARAVKPLDANGKPSADGKIVLLSIGMSNTTIEFSQFKRTADADNAKNPHLTIVDGAIGGQDAEIVANPNSRYWQGVSERLSAAGTTPAQVQAVWLKEAISHESEPFPQDAQHLQRDLQAIVGNLRKSFPNLELIYLSSRTYAGYATTPLNPEPYAYHSGFAVQWLVKVAIKAKAGSNASAGPWIGWGPYLWTNGTKGRSDGLTWTCDDVREDGTHPSTSGTQKVDGLLMQFFTTDRTARTWFLK